ncbi:hypothetical protein WMF18_03035 [Sorangium sp. So ce315]|uniref:hypothetical protein n=1 Tax=Sorangium sp. So ce315 TaxID=3133299 RepID=UPI003F5E798A
MTRAIRTMRMRTASVGAAILALSAGAALLGASCKAGPCRPGPDCPDPYAGTCPWGWGCAEPVWDGTYAVEGFNNSEVVAVWVGRPSEAPDCEASNYFPVTDLYLEPKTIDRCPRCIVEPVQERPYESVILFNSGRCTNSDYADALVVGEFVLPAGWDGSCASQRLDVVPAPEAVDLALGLEQRIPPCRLSRSLEDLDALWGKMFRVCRRTWPIDQYCDGLGTQCIPRMPPDFRECLQYRGDESLQECPRSHPELIRAHVGVDGCPGCNFRFLGEERTQALTFYADEHCTQPIPSTDTWGDGGCYDMPPGASPRSVSATYTLETVGECHLSIRGEQEAELRPDGWVPFCCRPAA